MRYGYIREQEDIRYLILYSMTFLPIAVTKEDIFDIVSIDDGFGYFEFAEAFENLVLTKHISELKLKEESQYVLSLKGQEVVELLGNRLRPSVRDKAQEAAIRVLRKIRRASTIKTSHVENPDGTFTVSMSITDNKTDIASVSMMVFTPLQCAMLENNFKTNAENIYKELINLLLERDWKSKNQEGGESPDTGGSI